MEEDLIVSLASETYTEPTIDAEDLRELVDFEPFEEQWELWNCQELELAQIGGTRSAKTSLQAPWLVREIQRSAPLLNFLGRGTFAYVGPTLTLLEEEAIEAFEQLFVEKLNLGKLVKGNKPRFRFSKQGLKKLLGFDHVRVTVTFAYAKDSSNLESFRALSMVWDEAGQKENKLRSYQASNRRLKDARGMNSPELREKVFAKWHGSDRYKKFQWGRRLWGSTPYEWNWFKTHIYDLAIYWKDKASIEAAKAAGKVFFTLFNWPSWKNPIITKEECERELEAGMTEEEFEMMYLGKFTRPRGSIFSAFNTVEHVCEPFFIPADWPIRTYWDFGPVHTAAVLVAYDKVNDHHYIFASYLQDPTERKKMREKQGEKAESEEHATLAKLHAANVRNKTKRTQAGLPIDERRERPISSSVGGNYSERKWRSWFARAGLPMRRPSTNDKELKIRWLNEAFAKGKYSIFRSCEKVIDEITGYARELDDDNKPTGKIKDENKFHRADCLLGGNSVHCPGEVGKPKRRSRYGKKEEEDPEER